MSAAVPHALTIAGSDPSGGAGIQADLKTFSALGAYGCAVLTSLTAQSTQGVTGVHPVPPAFVREQLDTLLADVRVDAVKIGMLGTVGVVEVLDEALGQDRQRAGRRLPHVVLDPVMVSTAGSRLLDEDAVQAVRRLVRHVDLVTPNLPEAAVLLGGSPGDPTTLARDVAQMTRQARAIQDLGCPRVLVKGGHAAARGQRARDEVVDVLVDGDDVHELRGPRVDTRNTHGTGCTLSSAIAALRPQRVNWPAAVGDARVWLTGALRHADQLAVGAGPGPVHHFWRTWPGRAGAAC